MQPWQAFLWLLKNVADTFELVRHDASAFTSASIFKSGGNNLHTALIGRKGFQALQYLAGVRELFLCRQPSPANPRETGDLPALREARQELTQRVMQTFGPVISRHLDQWFHFVPLWEQRT